MEEFITKKGVYHVIFFLFFFFANTVDHFLLYVQLMIQKCFIPGRYKLALFIIKLGQKYWSKRLFVMVITDKLVDLI